MTKAFCKTYWQPCAWLMRTGVTQHLDKWVELLRCELGTLCAVIDAPLTPGVPNKNNAISSHCGGASVPLPRTTHSSSVLRKCSQDGAANAESDPAATLISTTARFLL